MLSYLNVQLKWLVTWLSLSVSVFANAELLVEKQRFETENFRTFNGQVIKQVAVGWESYGQLNAQKDNVILITHFFSGSSHAAGKYNKDDAQAGYWDAIIGPGKTIDTTKYFVISVDSLANLAAYDPNVITTGPASINPDTGKPYGLRFPVVTIRDFVNVQKLVLESLGISKLHAVIGASMGSMQAIEWASAYPDWVPKMVSVIGNSSSDPWTTALLDRWTIPIKLDPNWNNGDYYHAHPPTQGLVAALMFITQDALTPEYLNQMGSNLNESYTPIQTGPLHSINNNHAIVEWLKSRAQVRAKTADANHLLYLTRASQLFMVGHGDNLQTGLSAIKAKSLFVPSNSDLLLMPYHSENTHKQLKALNKDSELVTLSGDAGHLNGVVGIGQQAAKIKQFIEQ